MLKIKETEDENKLSFQNDFKRLLELSKEDLLAEKTYEFLLDLYQNRYHSDGGFVVVFWNRFTGEIKKSYSNSTAFSCTLYFDKCCYTVFK